MATDTVLITHVTGKAWMRASDGQLVALHEGMRVPVDANILTDQGASVTLQATGVPPVIVGQNTDMLVSEDLAQAQPLATDNAVSTPTDSVADQVLAALDAGEDPFAILDPTAAVLGGGEGGGSSFTRLVNVVESTTPLGLAYPTPGSETPEFVQLGGAAGDAATAPLIPAGPTIDIPDENDVTGGDGRDPMIVPGTFSILENNTRLPGEGPRVALFSTPDDNQPTHTGANGIFTISAAAGLSGLQFTYVPESTPDAPAGTNPGGGNSTAAPEHTTISAAELVAATAEHPIVIDTDRGLLHITGYDQLTGIVSYTYWSDGAQDHDQTKGDGTSVFDSIDITVIDNLGRPASSTLVANILDTQPFANADVNQVTEDTHLHAKGNVITGWHESPDGADSIGADATTVAGVTAGDAGDVAQQTGVGTVIHGAYGDLYLNANGFYHYKLVSDPNDERYDKVQELGLDADGNPKTADDVFTYTLKDDDGDTATTTLTITVNGTNDPSIITFGGIDGANANAAVSEEGLRAGLLPTPHGPGIPDSDGTPDTTNSAKDGGTFTVHDVDAGDTVTVKLGMPADTLTSNGQTVHWAVSGDGQTLTGQIGIMFFGHFIPVADVLKVSLHDHGGGNYSYDVRLLAPIDHSLPGEDSLDLGVPILAWDGHVTTEGNLTVNIQDDSPLAVNDDGKTVVEDATGSAASLGGNVLLNDTGWGADGPKDIVHGFQWNGSDAIQVDADGDQVSGGANLSDYGHLTLGSAGGWVFELDNGNDATQALAEGETRIFAITYTLTDNDGDTSTATLTINIEGTNDAPKLTFDQGGDHTVVSEEGLTLVGGNYDQGVPAQGNNYPSGDLTDQTSPATDQAKDTGSFTVTDVDTNLANVTVSLGTATLDNLGITAVSLSPGYGATELTSHGAAIHWEYDSVHQVLQGYVGILNEDGTPGVGYRDIIKIELHQGETDGEPNGKYTYDVTLQGAIDHPDSVHAHEDVLNLNIPLTVDDGQGGVVHSSIIVRVEDDSPYVGQDQSATADPVDSPVSDGWSERFDFSGSSNPSGAKNFMADGVHIQVKSLGFDDQNGKKGWEINNKGHHVTQDENGLGVESKKGEPAASMPNELGYRDYDNQDHGGSEALIVSLKNQVATSITFELSKFYSNEGELGSVAFYRNGVLVGAQDFHADQEGGSYVGTFSAGGKEFDEVRFTARDNSLNVQTNDNSDYALKSITFSHSGEPVDNPVLAEATGTVLVQYGADGAGSITLGVDLASVTSSGKSLGWQSSDGGRTLVAYTDEGADSKPVFSLTMGEDGKWHFTQFRPIDGNGQDTGNGSLDFSYTVTDADGDPATGHINIALPDTNQAPVLDLNSSAAIVSEIDLTSTTTTSFDGSFKVNDPDAGDTLTVKLGDLSGATDPNLTSGDQPIVWTNTGNELVGKVGVEPIIQITLGTRDSDGTQHYTVTLLGPVDHGGEGTLTDGALGFNVPVTVSDGHGGSDAGTLSVTINDGTPSVSVENLQSVGSGATSVQGTLTFSYGADDGDDKSLSVQANGSAGPVRPASGDWIIIGSHGTLTIHGDNTYTYKANANQTAIGQDAFKFTITDADGDHTDATLNVTVNPAVGPTSTSVVVNVDEAGLSTGTNSSATSEIDSSVDLGAYTLVAASYSNTNGYGTITQGTGGHLVYTLNKAYQAHPGHDHGAETDIKTGAETITVQVKDADGNTFNVDVQVNIKDDVPTLALSLDSLNVTSGQTDNDTGILSFSYGADGATTAAAVMIDNVAVTLPTGTDKLTVDGANGKLAITANDDGTYSYVYTANANTGSKTDSFVFKVTDADGDAKTETLDVNIQSAAPTINTSAMSVVEAGAPVDGSFTITSHGSGLEVTVGGTAVNLSGLEGDDPDTQTIVLHNDVLGDYGQIVLTGYDPLSGVVTYTYQSTEARNHGTGLDDAPVQDQFTITAKDSGGTATPQTLTVGVTDTAPVLKEITHDVTLNSTSTNIMLVLDMSASMTAYKDTGMKDDHGNVMNRLEAMKATIANLLTTYGENGGSVMVNIVVFSDKDHTAAQGWMTLAEAKGYVSELSQTYTDTNYRAALEEVMSDSKGWDSNGKLPGSSNPTNVVYFFTDGEPGSNGDHNVNKIVNGALQAQWEAFLSDPSRGGIDAYAIGMGLGVKESSVQYLYPIGYDPEHPNVAPDNTLIVTDATKLNGMVQDLIPALASGNVTTVDGSSIGADTANAYIQSVTIGGFTYTYTLNGTVQAQSGAPTHLFDTLTDKLTINTSEGKLVIDLQGTDIGKYGYTATKAGTVVIDYTLHDGDNDAKASTITINVTGPVKPDAVDDHIITNILSDQITIDSAVLLANDERGTNPNPLGDLLINTGWKLPGEDFSRGSAYQIDFSRNRNDDASKELTVVRNLFSKQGVLADHAQVKVNGYLDTVGKSSGRAVDTITIALVAGELLALTGLAAGHMTMEYRASNGSGGWTDWTDSTTSGSLSVTADQTGNYQIRITNIDDNGGQSGGTSAESYTLTMNVDYSNAVPTTPEAGVDYTISGSGGSDTAHVTVAYEAGHTLHGGPGNDTLLGGSENDTLLGGARNDILHGGAGNDTLDGGAGNDVLFGGKGSDTLTGGAGDDVFVWRLGDQAEVGQPAPIDHVTDFGVGNGDLNGKDMLDLSDLLQGHTDGSTPGDHGDLSQYLSITGGAGKTVIDVKVNADGSAADHVTQQIVIDNTDLTQAYSGMDQEHMIQQMITDGKLKVD